MQKRIDILNDKAHLNLRYRADFIQKLNSRGYDVNSIGLLEKNSLRFLIRSMIPNTNAILITSNMRANLVGMLMIWKPGLVIVNGMGRHRTSRLFRMLLITLMRINRRKRFAVQCYADYRYFRMRIRVDQLIWIPGSGGVSRSTIHNRHNPFIVSRDDKIAGALPDIFDISSQFDDINMINVVGCSENATYSDDVFPQNLKHIGFVPQNEIFMHGNCLIQTGGYGEGFPHSLADALVSQVPVLIAKKEFLKYGIGKLGGKFLHKNGRWGTISQSAQLRASLHIKTINGLYLKELNNIINYSNQRH